MPGPASLLFLFYNGVWPPAPIEEEEIIRLPELEDCIDLDELITWDLELVPSGYIEEIKVTVPSGYIKVVGGTNLWDFP